MRVRYMRDGGERPSALPMVRKKKGWPSRSSFPELAKSGIAGDCVSCPGNRQFQLAKAVGF